MPSRAPCTLPRPQEHRARQPSAPSLARDSSRQGPSCRGVLRALRAEQLCPAHSSCTGNGSLGGKVTTVAKTKAKGRGKGGCGMGTQDADSRIIRRSTLTETLLQHTEGVQHKSTLAPVRLQLLLAPTRLTPQGDERQRHFLRSRRSHVYLRKEHRKLAVKNKTKQESTKGPEAPKS